MASFQVMLCRPGLIVGATLAAYVRTSEPMGSAIYWEQQQWLEVMGITDKCRYRKKQAVNGALDMLAAEFGFGDQAFLFLGRGAMKGPGCIYMSRTILQNCLRSAQPAWPIGGFVAEFSLGPGRVEASWGVGRGPGRRPSPSPRPLRSPPPRVPPPGPPRQDPF